MLLSDLHKRLAVLALHFHLLAALTGAFLGLEVIWWLMQPPEAAAPLSPSPSAPVAASLGDLIAAAQHAMPDAEPFELKLPRHEREPVVLVMRNDSPFIHHWSSHVAFDPATGAILDVYDASKAGFWGRLNFMIEPLHFGYYGGLAVKIAYSAFGLMLAALPVTGLAIWWSRLRKAPRKP